MKNRHYLEQKETKNKGLHFRKLNARPLSALVFTGLLVLSFVICSQSKASESMALYSITEDAILKMLAPVSASTQSEIHIKLPCTCVLKAAGLATHPITGELWTMLDLEGMGRVLAVIDPTTGEVTRHWSVYQLNEDMVDLAFHQACNGVWVMWFVSETGTSYDDYFLDMGLYGPLYNEPDPNGLYHEFSYSGAVANHAIASAGDCDKLYHASGEYDAYSDCSSSGDCWWRFEYWLFGVQFPGFIDVPIAGTMNGVTALTYYDHRFYWADHSLNLWQISLGSSIPLGILDHKSKGLAVAVAVDMDDDMPFPAGDLDCDCDVDFDDLAIVTGCFGQDPNVCDARADVNRDGMVNILDVSLVVSNFT